MRLFLTIAAAVLAVTAAGCSSGNSTETAATTPPTVAASAPAKTEPTTTTTRATTTTKKTKPDKGSVQVAPELIAEWAGAASDFDSSCWVTLERGGPGCDVKTQRFVAAINAVGAAAPEWSEFFDEYAKGIERSQTDGCRGYGRCEIDNYSTITEVFDPEVWGSAKAQADEAAQQKAAIEATVTYSVTGVGRASVTFSNTGDNTTQMDVTLPWSFSLPPLGQPDFLYVSAQIDGTGSISCAITTGTGAVLSSNTSSGQYVIVTCKK